MGEFIFLYVMAMTILIGVGICLWIGGVSRYNYAVSIDTEYLKYAAKDEIQIGIKMIAISFIWPVCIPIGIYKGIKYLVRSIPAVIKDTMRILGEK